MVDETPEHIGDPADPYVWVLKLLNGEELISFMWLEHDDTGTCAYLRKPVKAFCEGESLRVIPYGHLTIAHDPEQHLTIPWESILWIARANDVVSKFYKEWYEKTIVNELARTEVPAESDEEESDVTPETLKFPDGGIE